MENIKELIQSVNVVAREKNISENQVIDAICDGIATSLRKNFPEGSQLHVELDETMGTFRGWRMFNLVEQVSNPEAEMLFNEVDENDLVENNYVWEEFPVEIGRQQFNIIKQVTLQKIKSEEKKQQIDLLLEKPIKLYQGVVKVARKDSLLVDTFNNEIWPDFSKINLINSDKKSLIFQEICVDDEITIKNYKIRAIEAVHIAGSFGFVITKDNEDSYIISGDTYLNDKLISENKNIVIVGGSGLYIKALLYDYNLSDGIKNNIDLIDIEASLVCFNTILNFQKKEDIKFRNSRNCN